MAVNRLKRTIPAKSRNKIDKESGQSNPPVAAYPVLLHKLREMVFHIRSGDNWIRSISDAHLLKLYEFVMEDKTPEAMITYAKSTWNYPVNIKYNADMAAIKLFKAKVLQSSCHGLNPITEDEKTIRKQFMQRARSLMNQFDPIAEMVAVAQEQKRRVQMGLDQEIVDDKLNSTVSMELQTYNRMVHDLVEKFQRMGLIAEKPMEQVLQINGTFNSVIDLISKAGSQDKMLGIANDFLSKLEDSVVEMRVSDDGAYEVDEKV